MTVLNVDSANEDLRREIAELTSGNPADFSSNELNRRATRLGEIYAIIEAQKAELKAELERRGVS